MTTLLSIYKFAQIAGCDKTTVERAIKLGHLEDAVTTNDNGHPRIDAERGRACWARNWADTANATPRLREFLRGAPKVTTSTADATTPADTEQAQAIAEPNAIDWKNMSVAESRRRLAAAKAESEQLTLDTRKGTLVHIDDVRAAQFEIVQVFRRDIELLPTRIAAQLGIDVAGKAMMEHEVRATLTRLSELTAADFKVRKR